ncbi:MAG: lantibiotic dehydratase [Acidobacteriota bacterium]
MPPQPSLRRRFPSTSWVNSRFVCRTAGLPVSVLEGLRAPETLELHQQLEALDGELAAAAEPLVEALYRAVDGEDDRARRRALLRLKRDVHNGRRLRTRDLETATPALDDADAQTLRRQAEQLERRGALEAEALASYGRELVATRRHMQRTVDDDDFARALLLSSRTLADSLERYRRADPARAGAKARQIERGLLRYLTRMARKATPFSLFCTLLPGRLGEPGAHAGFDGSPRPKTSHLRLDKTLYARLLPRLLERPTIRRHLHVETNPTLRRDDSNLLFLTGSSGQGGHETFQRLAQNPALDLLRARLEASPDRHLPWHDLVQLLVDDPHVDADADRAGAYVDRLLEIGFLRFRLGIAEQEVRWDEPLAEILDAIDDDNERIAATVAERLRALRQLTDAYAVAPRRERARLLDQATAATRRLFATVDAEDAVRDVPPFYEDAGGDATARVDLDGLDEILADYTDLGARLAYPRREQAAMRHFFDQAFGAHRVPLLTFYERYYREHFKDHLERQRRADPATRGSREIVNPFGLGLVDALDVAQRQLTEHLRGLWAESPAAEEIDLGREALEELVAALPPLRAPCRSVSYFVQYLATTQASSGADDADEDDGQPSRLVARSCLAGFGKYFSRFLYLLPDDILRHLQATNRPLDDDVALAEICGDAKFNANLHPPLLPHEISYPTGESGARDDQLRVADLVVEPDPDDAHRLRLVHALSGRVVVPVDLGFLNPRMRPPLFQLLSRFTPVMSFNVSIPDGAIRDGSIPAAPGSDDARPAVAVRPRITYSHRLVLARRQWTVDGAQIPALAPGDDAGAHFLRMQSWRHAVGLPQEVFLRIEARGGVDRQHLYKPQYIDFASPLLVDLLGRLGESVDSFRASFEECLPGPLELLTDPDGERWATELILQVDHGLQADGADDA